MLKVLVRRGDASRRSLMLVLSGKQEYALLLNAYLDTEKSAVSSTNDTGNSRPTSVVNVQPLSAIRDAAEYEILGSTRQGIVHGCLGLVRVSGVDFLGVITDAQSVGTIEGHTVYRITGVHFYAIDNDRFDRDADELAELQLLQQKQQHSSFSNMKPGLARYAAVIVDTVSDATSSSAEEVEEHPCLSLQRLLSRGSFYFAPDGYDLTRNAQYRYCQNFGNTDGNSDERFVWNRYLLKPLIKFSAALPEKEQVILRNQMLQTVMQGFVSTQTIQLPTGVDMQFVIISRLSCKRVGTRFNVRGIDDDGNVANFVETEYLLCDRSRCFSYVVIRGSVPIFWAQEGFQMAQHRVQITRAPDSTQCAFDRHMDDLQQRYGRVRIVNLLSQKDGNNESLLSDAYRTHVQNYPDQAALSWNEFDYNQQCKGANGAERVAVLLRDLDAASQGDGYFLHDLETRQTLLQQKGVFRVNCIDCLDRTNVVQNAIVRRQVENFVDNLDSTLRFSSPFLSTISSQWASNGDQLSVIYAGTAALKSEVTLTGKRTLLGMMDDAKKTAQRFLINNFQDKSRQGTIDLLLGIASLQEEVLLYNPTLSAVFQEMHRRFKEYASETNILCHVGTWNVNGKLPSEENILPWLEFDSYSSAPDLLAIGFQEIVELTPSQIMSTDPERRLLWEQLLVRVLDKRHGAQQYSLLTSGQLVGASLCVFAKKSYMAQIRNVQVSIKKTGLGGMAGNKGGIGIRMDFYDTSICFVCAHFAAGSTNVEERNRDYRTISQGLSFSRGQRVDSHDNIIWLGDFNYRIDLANDDVRRRIAKGDVSSLLQFDQLSRQMRLNAAFRGFNEGPIRFLPTYKYDNGTDLYDSSEKARVPSWTDRILFRGQWIEQLAYGRAELLLSDHKPVKSLFQVRLSIVDKEKKSQLRAQLFKQFTTKTASADLLVDWPQASVQTGDINPWQSFSSNINPFEPASWKDLNKSVADPFVSPPLPPRPLVAQATPPVLPPRTPSNSNILTSDLKSTNSPISEMPRLQSAPPPLPPPPSAKALAAVASARASSKPDLSDFDPLNGKW